MAADDFSNDPNQGLPGDFDPSSAFAGNRPASGARRATPGEVLSQGFHGAQNAGDFLGLDVEFAGSQESPAVEGGSPLDLVAPPGIFPAGAGAHDPSAFVPEPAPLPQGDAAQEFAQAPSAFEFGEDLGSEEGPSFAGEESGPRKSRLFVTTGIVAVLAGAGVFFGPSLVARFKPAGTEVAVAPGPAPKAARPETARPETAPSSAAKEPAPAEAPVPEVAAPVARPEVGPEVAERGRGASEPVPAPAPRSTPSVTSATPRVEAPETDAGESSVSIVGPAPSAAASFPDLSGAEYAWASEDRLELIWRGSEVPLEAVSAPARTLMPRVGNVRVFTTAGDAFDGRLYAVGQNRVWIDAPPGRIGLDGQQVQRIEVLPPLPAGQTPGDGDLLGPGGKRVRVRVPGGLLFGRVIKIEGDSVLLAMEQGGRVSVQAADIEELGSGRAVVVRR